MAVGRRAKLALVATFLFVTLNVIIDIDGSIVRHYEEKEREPRLHSTGLRRDAYRMQHNGEIDRKREKDTTPIVSPDLAMGGYFNLSCPFEWSKYSCAYMQRGSEVSASTEYYLQHFDAIQAVFDRATKDDRPKRIFLTGDSLMRQLFIGIACGAWTHRGGNLVESAVIPWKDDWPCASKGACSIKGGPHSGYDAASLRLKNGMELHFVPHRGFRDEATSEEFVLERLMSDVRRLGRVTFGKKTAMSPRGRHVDVLVYNAGIHVGNGLAKKNVRLFAQRVAMPLMNATSSSGHARAQIIYVTTPTQHFNTEDGQWHGKKMTPDSKKCIEEVPSNPRADQEKRMLQPGFNVDILLDYDDLRLGKLHVSEGSDCTHYCMPGAPDVVGARLFEQFLV